MSKLWGVLNATFCRELTLVSIINFSASSPSWKLRLAMQLLQLFDLSSNDVCADYGQQHGQLDLRLQRLVCRYAD